MSDEVGIYIVERDGDPPSQRLVIATVNREKALEAFEQGGQERPEADILVYRIEMPTKTVKDQLPEVFILTQIETPDIEYGLDAFATREEAEAALRERSPGWDPGVLNILPVSTTA
ncbi:hypothetical protein [Enteractinococcus helveticum]|nr:hypothetical protein [Enteractinococcus helveticum]